ncbi:MAG: DUF2075 domain-containing protein [Blautia sp.]|nr:DUF2075 domain-containing protein [Blautia sp.]
MPGITFLYFRRYAIIVFELTEESEGWDGPMIIYSNTNLAFRQDVESNHIADIIEERFIERIGHREAPSEKTAWRNSMQYMERVLRNSGVGDDCGVLIEYTIPNTSKRVDFIVTGRNEKQEKKYVLVELKQWESAETTDIPELVHTFVGGGFHDVPHPSYQAESYIRMMNLMNEGIYANDIDGSPCVYLHNYTKKDPEPLLDSRYREGTKRAPIYFIDDYRKLQDYLKKMVGAGNGMDILYEIEHGRIRPSMALVDCVDSLYTGNDEFILLDEQVIAYNTICKELEAINNKKTIIVKGGPGTGKSVISFKVLHNLIDRRLNAKFVAPNEAFREVMVKKLVASKVDKSKNITPLFGGAGTFFGVPMNAYDVLVVDEAHRLKGKGAFMYKGENQIQDIIHASWLNVFFVDDSQKVVPADIGSVEEIRKAAEAEGSEVVEMELKAQFRCSGAEGFVNWVTHTLQIEDTANFEGWDQKEFEFRIFDDPNDMYEIIRLRNEKTHNSSRMVAGFAWEWSDDKNAAVDDVTIPEKNFSMPWNARNQRALFAIKEDSVNQIGCIHTVQGLEFDYVGVIIGNDLKYDPESHALFVDFDEYKDVSGKKGLRGQQKRLSQYVKQIYKVLMSRGRYGCYVYCRDENLKQYLKSRLAGDTITMSKDDHNKKEEP